MVSTIAASLELARQGEINLKQEKEFGEILLKKRKKSNAIWSNFCDLCNLNQFEAIWANFGHCFGPKKSAFFIYYY